MKLIKWQRKSKSVRTYLTLHSRLPNTSDTRPLSYKRLETDFELLIEWWRLPLFCILSTVYFLLNLPSEIWSYFLRPGPTTAQVHPHFSPLMWCLCCGMFRVSYQGSFNTCRWDSALAVRLTKSIYMEFVPAPALSEILWIQRVLSPHISHSRVPKDSHVENSNEYSELTLCS